MNTTIRYKSHFDRLWYAVRNNYNDTLGSDHAPHLKENKQKVYPDSPSGMPGVQTILPVMLNHVNEGRLKLDQLVNLLAENDLSQVLHNLPAGDWDAGDRGIARDPARVGEFQDSVGVAVEYATA